MIVPWHWDDQRGLEMKRDAVKLESVEASYGQTAN